MTFNFAPWAIDGARSPAGLARLAAYAAGGRSGVIQPGDLRVTALAVPGSGVRIMSGAASILNHYLANPDEAYVASNPSTHTVPSSDMPPATPGTSYYLVCIVVGDPEFNQAGHPFMPSEPLDPAIAPDFEYVRIVIVPCGASTTRFEDLGFNYPAYALARLEVPGSTSTITNAMITDLRSLAKPRTERKVLVDNTAPLQNLSPVDSHATWLAYQPMVEVPDWATRAQIVVSLNGLVTTAAETRGAIRIILGAGGAAIGTDAIYAIPASADGERTNIVVALDADVTALAGQSFPVIIQGYRQGAYPGYITTFWGTQEVIDIQFSENVV